MCSIFGAHSAVALVVVEEENEKNCESYWKSNASYHVNRFCYTNRMRGFFFSHLRRASVVCRMSTWIWSAIRTANYFIRHRSFPLFVALCDGIFARSIDDIVQWPFSSHVINANKFEQGGVDEAHTYAIPYVHRCQI